MWNKVDFLISVPKHYINKDVISAKRDVNTMLFLAFKLRLTSLVSMLLFFYDVLFVTEKRFLSLSFKMHPGVCETNLVRTLRQNNNFFLLLNMNLFFISNMVLPVHLNYVYSLGNLDGIHCVTRLNFTYY